MEGVRTFIASLLLIGTIVRPAAALETILLFAIDVSGSVDAEEMDAQISGYIRAMEDPEVMYAMKNTRTGVIFYGEDAMLISPVGPTEQTLETLQGINHRHVRTGRTCIYTALDLAYKVLLQYKDSGKRLVLDISGDGINTSTGPYPCIEGNEGTIIHYRNMLTNMMVEVNGLAITTDNAYLHLYYEKYITNGFTIPVQAWEDFYHALRQKILLEVVDENNTRAIQPRLPSLQGRDTSPLPENPEQ